MKNPKFSTRRAARTRAADQPRIPVRQAITQALNEQGVPVTPEVLEKVLRVRPRQREAFRAQLLAMERDGEIIRNRRNAICITEKADLVRGRIHGHPDGFGFLLRDDGGSDLFLSPREMREVLHGDRVVARISGTDRRGRPEGKIVEVLEHTNQRVVGRLREEHGIVFVVAEDRRISQELLVQPHETRGARPGQVVTVEILAQPSKQSKPAGRVVEVLGDYADPGMEIEIALRKHALPYLFPREAERLCEGLPDKVTAEDHQDRTDLTKLPLVTIDGEDARDFDDAVYCEPLTPNGAGFRLVVAIADVSHYVHHEDALDREGRNRGNSVYFPRRVIPMLPEKLSNGLCSLNPRVRRLAVVCDMRVDARGEIESFRFYPAVIRSHARLTYTEVAAMLENEDAAVPREHRNLAPHLKNLHRLYKILARARERRGAIDFETVETRMVFDERGKIERMVPVRRNEAHRLIEESMLAANVCASAFLRANDHPMLYRIHEGPTPEKLSALREFLKGFGLQLGGGDNPHASDYAKLLMQVKDRPDAQLLQTAMLRSLKQAVYSPDNVGHFGLAYESYTHFTSPIRRYPDLLVHRAIKATLRHRRYDPGDWHEAGMHLSMTERRADEATRDVEAWLKCYYMKDRIGEIFAGSVSAVTSFGVFVALDGVYVEGLVHVSELGNDYFHFDPASHQLSGERTRRRFRLGDRLRVRLVRVDLDSSKIDFTLA
jgi:ribonuclease R